MKYTFKLYFLIICLTISTFFMGCSKDNGPSSYTNNLDGYIYSVPEQTSDGWVTASLSDVGMSTKFITDLMNDLSAGNHFIHSIIIIKDEKLVFEEYFNGNDVELDEQVAGSGELKYTYKEYDRNTLHFQGSAFKSYISALVGIAMDKGFIPEIEEKMFTYFPEYNYLSDSVKNKITIAQMLTMTSGLPWDDGSFPIYDPRNDEYQLLFNEDPVKFVLGKSIATPPGTYFHYNSGTSFLLSEIVENSSHQNLDEFIEQYLFTPLGVTSYRWANSRNMYNTIFAGGLYVRPRDMAKFGLLFLQKGLWNGNRIISEQWTNESINEFIHFPSAHPPMPAFISGYGYQWWTGNFTNQLDVYCAAGWGGQFIMVVPEVNMIIVFTGGDYESNNFQLQFEIVNNFILPSML